MPPTERFPDHRQLALIQQLRQYTPDETTYGRIYADLHDLLEASAWLLETFSRHQAKTLRASEIETLLVDIDVKFAVHVTMPMDTASTDEKAAKKAEDDAQRRNRSTTAITSDHPFGR